MSQKTNPFDTPESSSVADDPITRPEDAQPAPTESGPHPATIDGIVLHSQEELFDADIPEPEFVIDGLVPRGGFTLISGKSKTGKSWFALQLLRAVAEGIPFLGRAVHQGTGLNLALEDSEQRVKSRTQRQRWSRELPIIHITELDPLDKGGIEKLRRIIAERRPVLVIIDTFRASVSSDLDENKSGPVAALAEALRAMAQHFNVALVLMHHVRKARSGAQFDLLDDIRGSSALPAVADTIIGIRRVGRTGYAEMAYTGRDIEEGEERIVFKIATGSWEVVEDSRDQLHREAVDKILALFGPGIELDASAMADQIGVSRSAVQQQLVSLRESGVLSAVQRGGKILYSAPEEAS